MTEFNMLSSRDFSSICRICLHSADTLQVFTELHTNLYKLLINIEVKTEGTFPKDICKSCATRLDDINNFIQTCKYNEALLQTVSTNESVHFIIEPKMEVTVEEENVQLSESIKQDDNVQELPSNVKFTQCLRCGEFMRHGSAHNHYRLNPECKPDESKCPMCDEPFSEKQELLLHLKTHRKSGFNKCSVCFEQFVSAKHLSDHIRNAHTRDKKRNVYTCPECSQPFTSAESISNHVKEVHPGVKPFQCPVCGKDFLLNKSLRIHMNGHKETTPYICAHCGESFKWRKEHTRHIYRNHNDNLEKIPKHKRKYTEKRVHLKLKCPICEKVFASRYGYSHHQLIHKGEKKFLCYVCGNKFRTNAALQAHLSSHSDQKPFQCENCGRSFKQKAQLTLHLNCHERNGKLNCSHCSKKFYTKAALNRHLLSHMDDKTNKCPFCGEEFHQRDVFDDHVSQHGGFNIYKCQVCSKRFVNKTHLDDHTRVHSGEKPFKCLICGKQLAHPRTLKVHMRQHTGEKPFACSICCRTFRDRSNFRRHFVKHQRNENEDNKDDTVFNT